MPAESTGAKSPHVVWFICDQLRADALGFMGSAVANTPNLDRLAGDGVIFEQMYCQEPVCMASRGSLHTGRYPLANGMANGTPLLNPRETTVPEILQRSGYRTGMFGKLHLTPQVYTARTLNSDRPITDASVFLGPAAIDGLFDDPARKNYGFQDVAAFEDILWGEYIDWLEPREKKLASRLRENYRSHYQSESDFPGLTDVGMSDTPPELHPSMFIAESAVEFFDRHHADKPCFMEVSFVDPHHPWDPPALTAGKYPADEMPLPKYRDVGELPWPKSLVDKNAPTLFADASPKITQTVIAYYYAMIELIDTAVGRVVDAIERAGELDNTLFVFIADHGEHLGSYGLFKKGMFFYDHLTRVPCMMSWKNHLAGGRRIPGLCEEVDIAPTTLSLIDRPVPAAMQGADLAAKLYNNEHIGKESVFCQCHWCPNGPYVDCIMLRTETAKLNYFPADRMGHLFDLTDDPDERHDLYRSDDHRNLRDQMYHELIETLYSHRDPVPLVLSQF